MIKYRRLSTREYLNRTEVIGNRMRWDWCFLSLFGGRLYITWHRKTREDV